MCSPLCNRSISISNRRTASRLVAPSRRAKFYSGDYSIPHDQGLGGSLVGVYIKGHKHALREISKRNRGWSRALIPGKDAECVELNVPSIVNSRTNAMAKFPPNWHPRLVPTRSLQSHTSRSSADVKKFDVGPHICHLILRPLSVSFDSRQHSILLTSASLLAASNIQMFDVGTSQGISYYGLLPCHPARDDNIRSRCWLIL